MKLPDVNESGEYTLTREEALIFIGKWLLDTHGTKTSPTTVAYNGCGTYIMKCRFCKVTVKLTVSN